MLDVYCLVARACLTFVVSLQGVFDVDPDKGLILKEIADGVSLQDIVENTGCEFQVSSEYRCKHRLRV